MIGYISAFSVMVVALGFVFGVRAGVLSTIILHPVAAAGWHVNYFLGPIKINPLVAIGLIVPVFVLLRSLTKGPAVTQMPLAGIWIVYLCYNVFAGTLHAVDEGAGQSLNMIARHLAGFVGFYMMQAFFTEEKGFKQLCLALIVSGFFPVLVILYQIATGSGALRELSSGGDLRLDVAYGLTRYSGFFHDIVSVRGYVFQCLAGIILYWAYFVRPSRDTVLKIILIGLGVACLFVLYKMYSKAAIGTLALWFLIWCFGYGKLGLGIMIGLLVVGVNALQSDLLVSQTTQLFGVDPESGEARLNAHGLLHGRLGVWEFTLQQFFSSSILEQMFGFRTAGGAHNDFLQKLFYGGYFGLIIYVLLLTLVGGKILGMVLRDRSPINLMAAMIFCGWMVDTIGVVPSLYPGYQWYAWGLIGLAIKGLDFQKGRSSAAAADESPPRKAPAHPSFVSSPADGESRFHKSFR